MRINYIEGDATRPIGNGSKIITHVCNDIGAWGAGFVVAVSRRWKQPEQEYRALRKGPGYRLGTVQLVKVEPDIWVANLIAQHGIGYNDNVPPIRYEALEQCLQGAARHATEINASIHMPRIGCGLAGGKWERVEDIISRIIPDIPVTVYDLPR